jgi:fatty acid synthase, animal type
MKLGPVGGIFNLAAKLNEATLETQNKAKIVESFLPKATATKYLDEVSRQLCPELHYFVVFSSIASGRGIAGQSNYGMANSVSERIMEQRHNLGLPAKAIQWGAIGDVGLVAGMQKDEHEIEVGGTLQQRLSSCLEELDTLMTSDRPVVGCMVVAEKRSESLSKRNILETIMNIMGIRDTKSISMETTLSELGMDSMMTVEIQQTLERQFDIFISAPKLRAIKLGRLLRYAEPKDENKKPEKVAMLLKNIGDETNKDEIILKLQSLTENGIKTLIIPGWLKFSFIKRQQF